MTEEDDDTLDLDALIQEADRAKNRGELDAALDGYKRALMLCSDDDELERASIYANVGEVKRAQGKGREAELNFEKALKLMPGYKPALVAMVELAESESDHRRVVQLRTRMVDLLDRDEAKVVELRRIGTVLRDKLDEAREAIEIFEKARALRPENVEVLGELLALYEKIQRWPKVAEIHGALCTEAQDPVERAQHRFAQADVLLGRLRDEKRGVPLLEATLEEDPTHEKALAALVALRTKAGAFADLERVYARLIDRHAERGDVERAYDLCKRLGTLRRDKLGDGPGAVEALEGAVKLRPKDADTRAALAELYVARGTVDDAVRELAAAAQAAPLRAQTFRRLFEMHSKRGELDRIFLTALALEELGAAELDHEMVISQFKHDGSLRPAAVFDDGIWDRDLRAPGYDHTVARMLRAVSSAAVKAKVGELTEQKRLVTLDPTKRQSPTSTATIVRTFAWAGQILGVDVPALYVLDDVPGGIAAAQVDEPSTAVGPSVLGGRTVPELAFLVARHLTYYRPEHYVLVFYPTLPELTNLVLATVKLALPEVPVPTTDAITKLRKQLAQNVGDAEKKELREAATDWEKAGGRVDLASWIRGVELTAQRAGFVLSGDFHVAMKILRSETRTIADLTMEDRRQDLLGYLAQDALADVRQRLKTTTRGSVRPPPM
jgi:tetratricopeptide (TPR) repeat protein